LSTANTFAGRVALVTGAASGIGLACAERFMAHGAKVIVWDIDAGKLARWRDAYGANVLCQRVDVCDAEDVGSSLAIGVEQYGKLDIVVNSAGIVGPSLPVWELPREDWDRVIRLNLGGTFNVCAASVPYLLANGYGRIVNLASIAGKEGNANQSAYSASKAGVIALTKSLGKELARRNVTVNAIAPASVETELLAQMSPEQLHLLQQKIPMGRPGTVAEIAALTCWLSSEESSFSTAAVFDASGGRATY
jgi:NAD(P)-dependent dehydrogenase (short-subunit alcohol dehydrogenase family)